jgi:hypothetical protein
MNTIILTERNIVKDTNNSIMLYSFQGNINFKNSTIGLASIHMYYSWYNITNVNKNNMFTYV